MSDDTNQPQQTDITEKAIDPLDLVTKPGLSQDEAAELLNNPAVTPPMPNEGENLRDDLKRD